MTIFHAVERTSSKGPGRAFVGTCRLCGLTNLLANAALLECTNPRGLTQEQSILEVISGPAERTVDLADVFGYGPSAPGWREPA